MFSAFLDGPWLHGGGRIVLSAGEVARGKTVHERILEQEYLPFGSLSVPLATVPSSARKRPGRRRGAVPSAPPQRAKSEIDPNVSGQEMAPPRTSDSPSAVRGESDRKRRIQGGKADADPGCGDAAGHQGEGQRRARLRAPQPETGALPKVAAATPVLKPTSAP